MKKENIIRRLEEIDDAVDKGTTYTEAQYRLKRLELEMKADYYATKEEEAKAHTETEKALKNIFEPLGPLLEEIATEYRSFLKQQAVKYAAQEEPPKTD